MSETNRSRHVYGSWAKAALRCIRDRNKPRPQAPYCDAGRSLTSAAGLDVEHDSTIAWKYCESSSGPLCTVIEEWSAPLRRQRSHVRFVSGAPVKSGAYRFSGVYPTPSSHTANSKSEDDVLEIISPGYVLNSEPPFPRAAFGVNHFPSHGRGHRFNPCCARHF